MPTPNAFELYRGLQDVGVPSKLIIYKGFEGVGHGPVEAEVEPRADAAQPGMVRQVHLGRPDTDHHRRRRPLTGLKPGVRPIATDSAGSIVYS